MENSNEIILKRSESLIRKKDFSSDIERLYQVIPPAMRERFTNNLAKMFEYEWESKREKEKAMRKVKAMCQSKKLGYYNQVVAQFRDAEDILFHDYSNKIVRVGKKADIPAKLLGAANLDKNNDLHINYKGKRWKFIPVEHHESSLPPESLNNAYKMRELGFSWDRSFIGKPVVPEPVPYEPKDPIFAILVGKWLVGLYRWK